MKKQLVVPLAILLAGAGLACRSETPPAAKAPAPAARQAPLPAAQHPVLALPRPAGGEWFGVYVLGKKVGYAYSDVRAGEWEGKPAVLQTSSLTLEVAVNGVETKRGVREERYYEAGGSGRLLGFKLERSGDGGNEVLVGRCSLQGIELTRKRPGKPDELHTLPATAETVENADPARLAAAQRRTIKGPAFDVADTLTDKVMTTEWLGEETRPVAGVSVPVVRARTTEEKSHLVITTVLGKDGRILEVQFGEAMVTRAEEEATARRTDRIDLFSLTRLQLDEPIPARIRQANDRVTYRVEGIAAPQRRESARQKYADGPDGMKLTVSPRAPTARLARPVTPGDDKELARALEPTLAIESKAPAIVALAQELVGAEKDAWAAAQRLNRYVHETLDKSYGTSSDRATDVLAKKRGDCTEHSLLMTTLARAAGIPARRVDGIFYMEASDGVPAFYWHEWVEVFVGEWVEMDPTFDQPVADATHIALGSEFQGDTAGLIGQVRLKVLEIAPLAAPAKSTGGGAR